MNFKLIKDNTYLFEGLNIMKEGEKYTSKELFTKCEDALNQIDEKHYEDELNEEGYEDVIKYGIAFYRKDCVIKICE